MALEILSQCIKLLLLLFLLQMYAGLFFLLCMYYNFKFFADNITDPTKTSKILT